VSSELVQVGIRCEKGILNGILSVGYIAQDAVCSSVQRGQATSEDLLQLLGRPLFTSNILLLVNPVACVSILHALFLRPAKVGPTRASLASSSKLQIARVQSPSTRHRILPCTAS
jgi:hypothetical protein